LTKEHLKAYKQPHVGSWRDNWNKTKTSAIANWTHVRWCSRFGWCVFGYENQERVLLCCCKDGSTVEEMNHWVTLTF